MLRMPGPHNGARRDVPGCWTSRIHARDPSVSMVMTIHRDARGGRVRGCAGARSTPKYPETCVRSVLLEYGSRFACFR